VLGRLRDELLAEVLGGLRADPEVAGVALVGSLGRGAGDNWSDVDLLVLMDGRAVARFAEEPGTRAWARAELVVDGRHNSPVSRKT
jgi:predicted nucleotidyltransferase